MPTAAIDREAMPLLRQLDLVLLAAALPLFLIAGWPMLGYAGRRRGAWLGDPRRRAAARPPHSGRARRAATAVGDGADRGVGSDARLVIVARRLARRARRPGRRPRRGPARPRRVQHSLRHQLHHQPARRRRRRSGEGRMTAWWGRRSTKQKVLLIFGVYSVGVIALRPDRRQRRQERRVPAPERVQARQLDPDPDRAARHEHQPRGPLSVPGQRPDDLLHDLHRAADADEAEQGPDGGRALLRPDQEQHHRRQPRRRDGAPSGSRSSRRSSSSSGSRT